MRVSVVICTLNRAVGLTDTLESLRYQNHNNFEVVVVNGPSTDNTAEILVPWADRVKLADCPLPNLSMSRNIGIRAASGDVVAFIDDDALPEFDWINQALDGFDGDEVAGVGGIVFDHTGVSLQYKYSAANRFAETSARHDRPYDEQCVPGSFQFPYLQGTNALFRRDALLTIGGFDETFDYYLDETDVCCRLVDAGFVLRQLDTAPVHHKFLPSGVRDHHRVVTNWSPIMKNHVYFSYRHALGPFTEFDIHEHARVFMETRIADARFHEQAGRLPVDAANVAAIKCAEAFRVGMQLGWERRSIRLGPVQWERSDFKRFPTVDMENRRKVTLVSSGFTPNMTGGIARFFSDIAPALARRGHEVRVITEATGPAAVDLENGVWVHRIESPEVGEAGVAPHVLPHINNFATATIGEIERIGQWSSHDIVFGPMWDVEVLGVLRRSLLPVGVHVATPLAVAAAMAGQMDEPDGDADDPIRRIMALERVVLNEADLFQANTIAVENTVQFYYPGEFDPQRWQIVNLGLADRAVARESPDSGPPMVSIATGLTVLYVGRFETRKGIDNFLEAVAALAPEFVDVRFVAAGEDRPLKPGLPPYGQTWLATHSDAGWIDRVGLAGPVSDDELHGLYANADLVVLPSRYESFGLVMVEALMHGKPLISCATGGILDIVRDGIDGLLVEPGNTDQLIAAMRHLLSDPAERERLGRSGRERFLEQFHIDRFAERFDQFLQRLSSDDCEHWTTPAGERPTTQVGPTGRNCIRMEEGSTLSRVPSGGADKVAIHALESSEIVLNWGTKISMELGQVRRIDVPIGIASIVVHVASGTVCLGGLISVALATES